MFEGYFPHIQGVQEVSPTHLFKCFISPTIHCKANISSMCKIEQNRQRAKKDNLNKVCFSLF